MEKFVCVRMVQGNGMDLSLFQFDYDMSFAVFFLNPDRTIYGRYGSRSHKPKEAHTDISLEGLAAAMKGALALHAGFPANRESLRGKTGPKPAFAVPEKIPALAEKYRAELAAGDKKTISRSCIHCHQIHDSLRSNYLRKGEAIPADLMNPWPMPEVVGMNFDRKKRATLAGLKQPSPAAEAGLKTGDEILRVNGQPIISIADVQWVLHRAGGEAALAVEYLRNGKAAEATLELAPGWRQKSDISWRTSSWALRRIATGGLLLESLSPEQRRQRKIEGNQMALRAEHVGEYNAHAAAKRAGFQKNDVIVSFDGRTDLATESALFSYVLKNKKAGDQVEVTVVRGDRRVEMKLPIQD